MWKLEGSFAGKDEQVGKRTVMNEAIKKREPKPSLFSTSLGDMRLRLAERLLAYFSVSVLFRLVGIKL